LKSVKDCNALRCLPYPGRLGALHLTQNIEEALHHKVVTRYAHAPYGTIGVMSDRRIRLSDDDINLVVVALRARAAMAAPMRRHRIERLATRLAEGGRGNPKFKLGEFEQTHEDQLDQEDLM
jgi:hypothetical protein